MSSNISAHGGERFVMQHRPFDGNSLVFIPVNRCKMIWGEAAYLTIMSTKPKPNAWHRFWHRVLCDIRWEDVGA